MDDLTITPGHSLHSVGNWAPWYAGLTEPEAYDETTSYDLGAEFLDARRCVTVEDWGCGKGYFAHAHRDRFRHLVRSIDGTDSVFADVVANLATYRPDPIPDGIFMRHVLEHNWGWRDVLANALGSFNRAMFLALFTPCSHRVTVDIRPVDSIGVPSLSLPLDDILDQIAAAPGLSVANVEHIATRTEFSEETLIRVTRES